MDLTQTEITYIPNFRHKAYPFRMNSEFIVNVPLYRTDALALGLVMVLVLTFVLVMTLIFVMTFVLFMTLVFPMTLVLVLAMTEVEKGCFTI